MLFVHGVGIREPDYARTAVAQLRAQFRAATNDERADDDLIIESAYWAPAVLARQDRLSERTVPGFASGWFGAMDRLTQKVATGSTLSLLPLALSGLVRPVPGIPKIHWPTLRWAVTSFVGDVVAYQVSPHSREVYDAVHAEVAKALARLAERLARWELVPTGTEGYKKAEVTLGGVDTRDLSQQTMESKQPGLYFIGEVVDVTVWLGGYNFQWAWASAHACALAL